MIRQLEVLLERPQAREARRDPTGTVGIKAVQVPLKGRSWWGQLEEAATSEASAVDGGRRDSGETGHVLFWGYAVDI